jgi:hypothetical protein
MSGRRIDDHSNWMGAASKGSPFPDGGHKLKQESSDGHAGTLKRYEDTSEKIKEQQEESVRKIHSLPRKSLHRN